MHLIHLHNIPADIHAAQGHNSGFTLIELLVVVLIIGILAAVALPEYTKAVGESRLSEGVMAVEEIAKANRVYYMANGQYSRDINALDFAYAGSGKYGNLLEANVGKHFIFSASAWGQAGYIASVSRRLNEQDTSGEKVYSLAIDQTGRRKCFLYRQATEHQKKLCTEWAQGNVQNW